jgi:hypothetical protein
MPRLIATLFEICLLRRGPQDLPHNPAITLALLGVALALEAFSASRYGGAANLLPSLLLSGTFALAATWAILRMRRFEARFWQTLMAHVGTSVLFALLALPLLAGIGPVNEETIRALPPLLAWGIVILAIWRLMVSGHVWRSALEVPLPVGVLVALGTFLAELVFQGVMLRALGIATVGTAPA